MSGFVYLWYDRKHTRFYVGSHWGSEDDGYVCSSRWMRNSYRRRPEDFKRRIIARIDTSRKALLVEEKRWLHMIKDHELKGIRYYNLNKGNIGHWTAEENAKSIAQKVSEKTKEAMQRPDVRERYLKGLRNRRRPHDAPGYAEKVRQTCLSKSINKGMITVRYPNEEKCFQVSRDDPRWLSGEVISMNKGRKRK